MPVFENTVLRAVSTICLLSQGPIGTPGLAGPSGNKGPIVSYPSFFSCHLLTCYRKDDHIGSTARVISRITIVGSCVR